MNRRQSAHGMLPRNVVEGGADVWPLLPHCTQTSDSGPAWIDERLCDRMSYRALSSNHEVSGRGARPFNPTRFPGTYSLADSRSEESPFADFLDRCNRLGAVTNSYGAASEVGA